MRLREVRWVVGVELEPERVVEGGSAGSGVEGWDSDEAGLAESEQDGSSFTDWEAASEMEASRGVVGAEGGGELGGEESSMSTSATSWASLRLSGSARDGTGIDVEALASGMALF